MTVQLFAPDSNVEALAESTFPFDRFLGTWHVIASTLPMWKGKQQVTLTYSKIEGHDIKDQIDDLVEYQKAGQPASASKSTVRGIDKRDVEPLKDGSNGRSNGTRWKWRGKGWLMIASSRWQLLGFDIERGWAVSYFKSTLFTPSGLDLIVRDPHGFDAELKKEITEAIAKVEDEEIRDLAGKLFDIPHVK